MRVVPDTNILISALISPGKAPDRLYEAWRTGRFVLLSSEAQMNEFRRVSRYSKLRPFLRPAAAGAMLNELRELALLVSRPPRVSVSPDPADDFLLAIAEEGSAGYLVTGDKSGLLALKRHKGTRIVSASQMLELLG